MISASREERTAAMLAVIDDILLSGHGHDFNPLAVSVERPRVPVVGEDGETYWEEVGICRVVIEGAVEKNLPIHFEEDLDPDPESGVLMIDGELMEEYFGAPAPVLVEESDGKTDGVVQA